MKRNDESVKMDIFREFFEQHWRPFGQQDTQDFPQDILNDFHRGQECEKHSQNWDFDVSSDVADNFVSEFEEAFEGFFKTFIPYEPFHSIGGGQLLFPDDDQDETTGNAKSLQERMLKNDTAENSRHHLKTPLFPFDDLGAMDDNSKFTDPSFATREDRDLDEDLRNGDKSIDDVLPSGKLLLKSPQHEESPTSSFFFSSSSSVMQNQDGVFESKKTVTDSSGNKEVTITRKDADGREHTMSYRTDRYGNEIFDKGSGYADREKSGLLQSLPDAKDSYQPRSSFYDRIRHWFNEKKADQ